MHFTNLLVSDAGNFFVADAVELQKIMKILKVGFLG
jgi:hypothetical protein